MGGSGSSVILSVNGNASHEPSLGQILVYDAAAGSSNANTNLRLDAQHVDGQTIAPQAATIVSIWRTYKQPTAAS